MHFSMLIIHVFVSNLLKTSRCSELFGVAKPRFKLYSLSGMVSIGTLQRRAATALHRAACGKTAIVGSAEPRQWTASSRLQLRELVLNLVAFNAEFQLYLPVRVRISSGFHQSTAKDSNLQTKNCCERLISAHVRFT